MGPILCLLENGSNPVAFTHSAGSLGSDWGAKLQFIKTRIAGVDEKTLWVE